MARHAALGVLGAKAATAGRLRYRVSQLRLEQLDPMLAATLRKAAEPGSDQWSEAHVRAAEARNKQAISASHQHGARLAAAQYPRYAATRRSQG